jgi:hypothetical protein
MLTYRLSDRQKKELLIRGQVLEIAIPCNHPDCDPVSYACDAIPEHSGQVVSAEIADLAVWRTANASPGFTGLMGHISSERNQPSSRAIEYTVVVVIATLQAEQKPRGRVALAWPGKAFRNGVEINAEIT